MPDNVVIVFDPLLALVIVAWLGRRLVELHRERVSARKSLLAATKIRRVLRPRVTPVSTPKVDPFSTP